MEEGLYLCSNSQAMKLQGVVSDTGNHCLKFPDCKTVQKGASCACKKPLWMMQVRNAADLELWCSNLEELKWDLQELSVQPRF